MSIFVIMAIIRGLIVFLHMEISARAQQANKVTLVGFFINLLLTIGKLFAGLSGKSGAMVADGVHSLSDLVTDIIVIVFVGVSDKEKDSTHHYGHGKYETFATMLISFALLIVAIGIGWNGVTAIISSLKGNIISKPGMIAFYAALVSIVSKEALYWYTIAVGKKIESQAVIANGWHHRSDAFSSVGTALGIGGAIFLGEQWRILDPLAGLVVSFFIAKVALDLGTPSVKELLEAALPKETREEIIALIENVEGVKKQHNLRTRKVGNIMAIEVHVKVNKDLSVEASHNIATNVENVLRLRFGNQTHVGVHIEPYYEKA